MKKIKYYFTLGEAIKNTLGSTTEIDPYNPSNNLNTICSALEINTEYLPFTINDNVQRLWKEIYSLYRNEFIYTKDYGEAFKNDFKEWLFKFIGVVSRTFDYYNTLLNSYDQMKTKLIDDIKTSTDTTIKYNDTPQNDAVSGFDDDNHTTNITNTHNESTTPFATPMEKLKSLQDNYQMIYNKWCKEFGKLFIEEQTTWGC